MSSLAVSVGDVAGATVRALLGVVLVLVVTLVALRLLGIRRGWSTALLAGFVGWGVAVLVSVGLAKWDWGSDGLVVHVVAIGVPLTMAVAVGIDLLARPGTLATSERAGLVVAPRLVHAIRTRVSVLRRYRELAQLAREEGVGPFQRRGKRVERSPIDDAVRVRRVLERAGGVYVKLGQIAATRVDLLPAELCDELAQLQNRVPPEPQERIAEVLEAELGSAVEEVFAEFDWEPLAAASIGQTHRATLATGEHVVVKVQRPGIAATMERDLAALRLLAEFAQRRTPFGRDLRSGDLLAHFATSLRAELDFRREVAAMVEFASRLEGAVRVPQVHHPLCTRRVLVQERFEGATVSDLNRPGAPDADRADLADRLLRSTLDQVMKLGFFHADPHPGNVFALEDGSLGLIDFGAMGRLDSLQQKAVVDIFFAVARRDVGLLREGVERIAEFDAATSTDQLERALARMMADFVLPSGHVDPHVMEELVTVLPRFGIRLPADIVLLSRALVTVDGTLRVLCPDLSLMTATMQLMQSPTAPPLLEPKDMIRDELLSMLPLLRRMPERIDRVLAAAGKGELRVHTITDEDGRRMLRTLVNRALLGGIGAVVLGVSSVLLVATDPGPSISEGTGLFEVFGYGGLLAGSVLVLRVVDAIARDGTT